VSDAIEQEIRILRALFWSERDPEGRAFVPLADAYLRDGDPDEALSLLREGLDRHPRFASAHLVAARAYRARGDGVAAEAALRRVLEFDPGNAVALRIKGEMAEAMHDIEAALEAFREAFRRNPGWEDLEGRIERLAAGLQGSLKPVDDADEIGTGSLDVGTTDWDPAEVDLDGTLDFGDAFDQDDGSGTPDAEIGGEVERSSTEEGSGEPASEDPLEFGELELEPVEQASVERERAGDLDVHESLIEGHAGRGAPPAAPDIDFLDPFGLDESTGEAVHEEAEKVLGAGSADGATDGGGGAVPGATVDSSAGEPAPEDPDAMVTRTLGELYARQGLTLKALEVFEVLALRHPDDEAVASRVEELRREVDGDGSGAPEVRENLRGEAGATASGTEGLHDTPQGAPRGEETEEDMMGGTSHDPAAVAARMAQRPVSDWFGDLLAWEPGAVPVGDLAPSDRPIEYPVASRAGRVTGTVTGAEVGQATADETVAAVPADEAFADAPDGGSTSDPAEVADRDDADAPDRTAAAEDGSEQGGASGPGSGPEGFEGLEDFQDWLRSLNR
jgi:tetratricopeptide (TPR) repeat protein